MQRRILLTGSNGLLGQKIVNQLVERINTPFIATSRGVNRHKILDGYRYKSVDMTDTQKWENIFADFLPTDVINTAAMTQVDVCETEREKCDAINVHAVENLCNLCVQYQSRLVHVSTDFVFDGSAGPYKETDTPNPVNYYGMSKLKAEQIIQKSGANFAILRTMLLYGVTPAMSRSNIVLWVKDSLEKKKPIKVVDDQVRCPTFVEDLASACLAAVMRDANGIYHISGTETMDILQIAHRTAAFWNLDESLISATNSASLNQAAQRPPVTGFILLKAQTELGYSPHSFEQGLSQLDKQLKAIKY